MKKTTTTKTNAFLRDLVFYKLCFPGAVTGSTEVDCPHCDELLTIRVNGPMGEGQVRYDAR